jgi:hypothetical protein
MKRVDAVPGAKSIRITVKMPKAWFVTVTDRRGAVASSRFVLCAAE